jgi:hypothetical protein
MGSLFGEKFVKCDNNRVLELVALDFGGAVVFGSWREKLTAQREIWPFQGEISPKEVGE